MVTKERKAKAKRNMDTFFLQPKTLLLATPTQGVTVANYLSLWAPLLGSNGSGDINSIWNNAEFNLYRTMYDKVRINSVTMTVTPKANVLDMVNAQNEGLLNVNGDGCYHSVIDRDDHPPQNINRLSRYSSYKRKSLLKPITRRYAIRYPQGVWLDCQNIYGDTSFLQRLGLFGGILVYAENILEENLELFNEPYADVQLSWNCVFQGKNSANISFDPDTLDVCVSPTKESQIVPDSVLLPIGTITAKRFDASGVEVSYPDTSPP